MADVRAAPLRVPGRGDAAAVPAPVEFRFTQTDSFVPLLQQLGASLLVSTYQANKLLAVRASGRGLSTLVRTFDKPMGLAVDASSRVAASARAYAELESRVLNAEGIEGVALRYGFFYGPGTWYNPDGAAADQARKQELAIIGAGEGVWSWVHIEDAAVATVAALTAPPRVAHDVDDEPSAVGRWRPAFARWVGAPPPPRVTEDEGCELGGEDAVYYGNRLRGASNAKAKTTLNFAPRRLVWLDS